MAEKKPRIMKTWGIMRKKKPHEKREVRIKRLEEKIKELKKKNAECAARQAQKAKPKSKNKSKKR